MRSICTLLVFLFLSICASAQNLITNPDFSLSYGWNKTGNFQYDSRFTAYRSQYAYAYFTDFAGLPANAISGTLDQTFYVPSNATGFSLSFYYRITTAETTSVANDTCGVWLTDQSTLTTIYLGRLSNLDANTVYQPSYFLFSNLPTGRNYKLVFSAHNNALNPTVFRIDDVLATLNPTYSPNCVSWLNNRHPASMVDSAMNKLCMLGIISSSQDTNTLSGLISKSEVARYIGRALIGADSTGVFSFLSYIPDLLAPGRKSIVPASDTSWVKLMQYLEYNDTGIFAAGPDNIAPFPRDRFFPSYGGSMLKSDAVKAMLEAWNLSVLRLYDPTSTTLEPNLCDVPISHKNGDYIERAMLLGLFNGMTTSCSTNRFYYGADNQITYKEFFVMLSRMLPLYHKPISAQDFFIPNQYYYNNITSTDAVEQGAFGEYSGKGIDIPSGGPGLSFEFSYHSGLTEIPTFTGEDGLEDTVARAKLQPLGGGWTHSYSAYIKSLDPNGFTPSRILIYWPDGAVHSYLVQQGKYETKGITDQLTIDSFNAVNQPAQVRIRRGRTVYTFRNIDRSLYTTLSLISITDAHGNKVGLSYTTGYAPLAGFEPKLLSTVTDSFSMRSLQFVYDPATNYLKSVTDPAGRQFKFWVNPYFHDLDSSEDAKGQRTVYQPNIAGGPYRSHLLLGIRRPKGNYITNSYADRKLKSSASGNQQIYVDRVLSYQSPLKEQNTSVKVTQNGQTITTNYTFDAGGNTISATSDVGAIQRVYDTATNRLLLERDLKLGIIKKYGYDANGYLNRSVTVDSIFNDSTKYEYVNNAYGEVMLLKDENDSYTQTQYIRNSEGKPTSIIANQGFGGFGGVTHTFGYNANGLLASYNSPLGYQTSYWYNTAGDLTSVEKLPYPLIGSYTILTERYSYDNLSRITKHKDYVGDSVTYSYDNNDNPVSENKDPGGLGLLTLYGYDANDNPTSITSPKGHTTTLGYDFNTDDLIEENDGTDKKKWRYNQDGTLDSFVTKNGVVFKHTYYNSALFPGTNLTGLLYSDGQSFFTYDTATKNLKTVVYNGKSNIIWNPRGRWNKPAMVGVQNYFAGGVYDAVSYEYDEHQRPSVVAFPSFSTSNTNPYHLSYIYDPTMRWLSGVYEDNRGKWYVKYDYRNDNTPSKEIYNNGDTTYYHYDSYNRLDSMWAVNRFGQLLYSTGATLDANGRHTSENLKIVYQGVVDTTLPPIAAGTASYTYQLRNRILTGDGRTYASDNAGNIDTATSPSLGLTWSSYDKLLSINHGSSQTTYEYDGLGIRRRKDLTYYVTDQSNANNVLVEATQSGVGISTYIWGNGLVARVNPQNDSTYYYHYDFRGSVVCITNQNGQVVQFYKYDPWGKAYAQKGTITWNNPYQFMGRHGCQTDDSDVYYVKARYYQPSTGRFLSEDPKWNTNLFVYGDDDPVNNIDPTGEYSVTDKVSIGESLIPVWGNWRQGMYNAKQGNYWTTALYTGLAIGDLVGIGESVEIIKDFRAGIKAERIASTYAKTYFEGAQYSEKVLSQFEKAEDIYHAFSEMVDVYATKYGKWSMELGKYGKLYEWLRVAGTYNGEKGFFEYTKDLSGLINHRYFNPF